jgi:hypothetical protein
MAQSYSEFGLFRALYFHQTLFTLLQNIDKKEIASVNKKTISLYE